MPLSPSIKNRVKTGLQIGYENFFTLQQPTTKPVSYVGDLFVFFFHFLFYLGNVKQRNQQLLKKDAMINLHCVQ